jgi:hypothetical protein
LKYMDFIKPVHAGWAAVSPRAPRTRASNSDVRISARLGRPIKTTPSPSHFP